MNESILYDNFNGYNAYPIGTGEQIIRDKLTGLLNKIIKKNETCLLKARQKRMIQLLSMIMLVKKRMNRIKGEMERSASGAAYKLETLTTSDDSMLRGLDLTMEKLLHQCSVIIDSLNCMETDVHINDRYAQLNDNLRKIELLFHQRVRIFKRMCVYG